MRFEATLGIRFFSSPLASRYESPRAATIPLLFLALGESAEAILREAFSHEIGLSLAGWSSSSSLFAGIPLH